MRPVPEYDAKAWLLKALRETSHAMEALVLDIDDEDLLARRPAEDEWCVVELVRHMAEMEERYVERLEHIVQAEEPRIKAFDADSIEAWRDDEDSSVFEHAEDFGSQRQRAVYLLWSLDDADWQRRGVHPYLGPLTVLECAREMNEHDLGHLWQLRRLCDRFAAVSV
jgi:hypothetical protein